MRHTHNHRNHTYIYSHVHGTHWPKSKQQKKTDQIQTFRAKTDASRKSYAEFGSSENHSPKSVCVCVSLHSDGQND